MDGHYLARAYRDHLSDFPAWEQKDYAKEWVLLAENMGVHLSIDETSIGGYVYTILSRKDAKGKKKVIAIIRGVKSSVVSKKLLEIPEELRKKVIDASMDFSDSMKLIVKTVFPQAVISLDRFHVIQDLINHMMETYTDVRKRLEVEEKHERAAYYKKVDACAKNRKRYRKNNPKNYKGKKRGRKPKYRKSDFKPSRMESGESKRDFLRRCFKTLKQNPDKWSDEQQKRMQILFNAYPEIKEAYDLKEEFRTLYWSKKTNLEYKDKEIPVEERNAIKEKVREKLHTWYDHVNASKCPGMKSFKRTIKEREEDLLNYYTTFVTNAHSESLNSGIKALRTEVKGVSDLPFFFFRVCKIFG